MGFWFLFLHRQDLKYSAKYYAVIVGTGEETSYVISDDNEMIAVSHSGSDEC